MKTSKSIKDKRRYKIKMEWNYNRELIVAKEKESYHRKKMEHFQEKIKLIEQEIEEIGKSRMSILE